MITGETLERAARKCGAKVEVNKDVDGHVIVGIRQEDIPITLDWDSASDTLVIRSETDPDFTAGHFSALAGACNVWNRETRFATACIRPAGENYLLAGEGVVLGAGGLDETQFDDTVGAYVAEVTQCLHSLTEQFYTNGENA